MKNLLLLVMLALGLGLGCKKEDKGPNLISDPCLVDSSFIVNTQYPIISSPQVNPNNPDEIAFLRDKFFSTCCNQEIMVFNLKTKILKSIYSGLVSSLDWGSSGWITFGDDANSQVFTVKSNGDSLIQITNYGTSFKPKWNIERSKMILNFASPNFDTIGIQLLSNQSSNLIKTQFFFPYDVWHHDSLLTTLSWDNSTHIYLFSLNQLSETNTYPLSSNFTIQETGATRNADWVNLDTMVIAAEKGIWIIDYTDFTHPKSILITSTCPSLGYGYPTVARQTQQVILERYDYEITGEKEAIRTVRFVRMNLDGTGEEVIEIPGL
jgi:hypothetical protein